MWIAPLETINFYAKRHIKCAKILSETRSILFMKAIATLKDKIQLIIVLLWISAG